VEDIDEGETTVGAPVEKRRRLAVIMFTDIEGPTVLVRQLGQERAREIVGHHNDLLKRHIEENGAGTIEKFTGDGVFATFEHPSDAINCAIDIQRELHSFSETHGLDFPFRIRIGLHLGEIVYGSESAGEIVSQHINCAARVMGIADGGQILTTIGVFEAARGLQFGESSAFLEWANHGEFNLKGIGPSELYEVSDTRIRRPEPPTSTAKVTHSASMRRLENLGYEIHSRIGQGSMGVVYLAETPSTDDGKKADVVAIKMLASTLEDDPEARERFTRETKVISTLDHPGIIRVDQVHTDDSPPFFTMEWVEGKPVTEVAAGMSWENKAELIAKVCDALGHAHQHAVVHRDLKPSNILVRSGGQPVILDFGLSMAFDSSASVNGTSSSGIIGTPVYLSPEQAESRTDIGPAADIYSMGALLHEVITGEPPFTGPSVREILDAHVHEDPVLPTFKNPSVPDALQRVCLMALEKAPGDRYPTASEMAEDLRRFVRGDPVLTRPRLYDNLVRNRASRHRNEVGRWYRDHLITPFEHAALAFAYKRLVRGGAESLMEARLLKAGVLMLYLAGWLIVNGTAIWLTQHWGEGFLEERWVRVGVGIAPAVIANGLWWFFFIRRSFQRAYVMMIVGIVAMPLALGIILFEAADAYQITLLAEAWFFDEDATLLSPDQGIANSQMFINFGLCVLFALWATQRSRTVAASALSTIYVVLFFQVILDFKGLLTVIQNDDWATYALYQVPLVAVLIGAGYLFAERFHRRDQCVPWFVGAFLILIAASQSMAIVGPDEWAFRNWQAEHAANDELLAMEPAAVIQYRAEMKTRLSELSARISELEEKIADQASANRPKDDVDRLRGELESGQRAHAEVVAESEHAEFVLEDYKNSFKATTWFHEQIVEKGHRPAIGLAEFLVGFIYLAMALGLRRHMAVEALPAYTILIWLSPLAVLGGLTYMDVNWPGSWFSIALFGEPVPPPSLTLLVLALGSVIAAALVQSRVFVLVGLGFSAYALWLLGARYLQATDSWPIAVLLSGLVVTAAVVVRELLRPSLEEIDPLAGGLMKPAGNPVSGVPAAMDNQTAATGSGKPEPVAQSSSRIPGGAYRWRIVAALFVAVALGAGAAFMLGDPDAPEPSQAEASRPQPADGGTSPTERPADENKGKGEAAFDRGEDLRRSGQFAAAVEAYTEAIKSDSENKGAYYGRAKSHSRLGQHERAIEDWSQYLRIGPGTPFTFQNRGDAYLKSGNLEAALRDYQEAVALAPDSIMIPNGIAWLLATTPDPGARSGVDAIRFAKRAVE